MSTQSQLIQIGNETNSFRRRWKQEVVPLLGGSNLVPVLFVQDIITTLLNDVLKPVTDLQAKLIGDLKVQATDILGGNVMSEILSQSSLVQFIISQTFVPEYLPTVVRTPEGLRATTKMPIILTGGNRFDSLIEQAIDASADAIRNLQALEVQVRAILGPMVSGLLDGITVINRAIDKLIEVIKSVGAVIYNSVVGLGRAIDLLLKGGIIAGAAYIGYQFFKPQQKTNPARRGRRRRRLA